VATIAALRSRIAKTTDALELAPVVLGVTGLLLGWSGAGWDVAWHRALGRDTFWSAPHVLMYTGTTLVGLSSLVALFTAMRGRPARTRELAIGPLHVERSLALVGFGALGIISAAPFDDLWHRLFGRDVDIWSPPHMVAVVGAALAYTGWATAATRVVADRRVANVIAAVVLGGLIGTFVFGMNFYYVFGWSREAFLYPVIVCATVPFALAMGVRLLEYRYAATAVALTYTLMNLVTLVALRGLGWPPAAVAPLVVARARAAQLLPMRTASTLAIGAAFAVAFVVAEGLRMVISAPLPSAAVLSDPTVGHLAQQYWAIATARPWSSAWPLLAAAVGAPLAALAWVLGGVVTRVLTAR